MTRSEYNKTIFNLNVRIINIAFIKPFIKSLPLMIFFSVIYFLLFKKIGNFINILLGIIALIVFLFSNQLYEKGFINSKIFVSSVYMDSLIYKNSVGSEYFDYMLNVNKFITFLIDNKLYYLISLIMTYIHIMILMLCF